MAQGPATWRLVTACEELVMQGRLHGTVVVVGGLSAAWAVRRSARSIH
ncbi:hypothetical protein ACIQZB_27610 [Streptomyces sp. NPDC097727]